MKLIDVLQLLVDEDIPYKWSYTIYLKVDVGEAQLLFCHPRVADIESGKYNEHDLVLFEVSTLKADLYVTDIEVCKGSTPDLVFVYGYYDGKKVGTILIDLEE